VKFKKKKKKKKGGGKCPTIWPNKCQTFAFFCNLKKKKKKNSEAIKSIFGPFFYFIIFLKKDII
jgi:hypothetical protein